MSATQAPPKTIAQWTTMQQVRALHVLGAAIAFIKGNNCGDTRFIPKDAWQMACKYYGGRHMPQELLDLSSLKGQELSDRIHALYKEISDQVQHHG